MTAGLATPKGDFHLLQAHVMLHILQYLDPHSLKNVTCWGKNWRALLINNPALWQRFRPLQVPAVTDQEAQMEAFKNLQFTWWTHTQAEDVLQGSQVFSKAGKSLSISNHYKREIIQKELTAFEKSTDFFTSFKLFKRILSCYELDNTGLPTITAPVGLEAEYQRAIASILSKRFATCSKKMPTILSCSVTFLRALTATLEQRNQAKDQLTLNLILPENCLPSYLRAIEDLRLTKKAVVNIT